MLSTAWLNIYELTDPIMQTSRAVGTLQLPARLFCCCPARKRLISMQAAPQQQQLLLIDAHCHPQLDPAHMPAVLNLRSSRLAAMSVCYDVDWDIMLQLHKLAGDKVIPGFGIHPWWSHLHASSQGNTWPQLLEAPSPEQLQRALEILSHADPVTNSGAYATNRPNPPDPAPVDSGGSFTGLQAGNAAAMQPSQQPSQPPKQQHQQQQRGVCLGEGLRVVPVDEWMGRLRQLLTVTPSAIVGEVGIDRSATIPGSRARTSLQHQMELLRMQVAVAAEFMRPVSVHCVKGYGHLLDFFSALDKTPDSCPPRVMLHSYGGSVEEIPRFCKLPHIGSRFYFSFSHAINHRTPEKLRARVAAVPADRLLLESDQVTPLVIDDSLQAMAGIIADVRGWTLHEAAEQLADNFNRFYQNQL